MYMDSTIDSSEVYFEELNLADGIKSCSMYF